jgi:hypothetical protein
MVALIAIGIYSYQANTIPTGTVASSQTQDGASSSRSLISKVVGKVVEEINNLSGAQNKTEKNGQSSGEGTGDANNSGTAGTTNKNGTGTGSSGSPAAKAKTTGQVSLSEVLSDPRLGTMDKIKLGIMAVQIKSTDDPKQVTAILKRNQDFINSLQDKGLIDSEDMDKVYSRLDDMAKAGESFDFAHLFQ